MTTDELTKTKCLAYSGHVWHNRSMEIYFTQLFFSFSFALFHHSLSKHKQTISSHLTSLNPYEA